MTTGTPLAALGVGSSAISNAATAVAIGIQAVFVNPLTVGAIGGLVVGYGVYALRNRLRRKPEGVAAVEEVAPAVDASTGG